MQKREEDMIQLNLDAIEAVLDRANDDADRVSVYEYREALNALYQTAMRILSEKMALEAERIELRGTVANLSTSLDCSSERHIWELEDLRTERDEAKARLKAAEEHESLAEARAFALEQERDELKTRLAHAEADAEQAIHNEAFQERQRIVAWIRARLAHSTLDDRVSFRERGVMIDLANALERGEHER
ncbi:MAG: hypothetical protein EBS53_00560 [Bacteroidetes bacterium]|nr:hypothetical protein [Bacteroidota bacterium]